MPKNCLIDSFFYPNKNWNVQIINRFHEFYRGSSKLIFRLISNFIMSYNVKVLGPKFTKIRLWIYTQTNHLFSLNAIKILLQNGAHLASATLPWHWFFFAPPQKSQSPKVALVDFSPDGCPCSFCMVTLKYNSHLLTIGYL